MTWHGMLLANAGAATEMAASGAVQATPRVTVRRVMVLLVLLVVPSDAGMPLPSPIVSP